MALKDWIDDMTRRRQSDVAFQNGDITLREYIEAILAEKDKAMMLADEVLKERLDKLNHLYEMVARERGLFPLRDACDERHSRLVERFEMINEKLTGAETRLSNFEGRWLATLAVATLAFAGLAAFIAMHG